MSLLQNLQYEYKSAFKEKRMAEKIALNLVLAQIKKVQIDSQKELSDEEIQKIIKSEVKSILEAIEFLKKAEKEDDIVEERLKLAVLEKYLPVMMSQDDTKKIVLEIIGNLGIEDVQKDRGKIIGEVMKNYKGQIDGGLVQKLLNNL